jgi:teichuronic acid biosynthesis glycosyltransferase TuaH
MLNIKFKYDIVVVGLQPWTTSLGSNSIDLAKELSKTCRILYVNRASDRRTELKKWITSPDKLFKFQNPKPESSLTKVCENIWVLDTGIVLESINMLSGSPFRYLLRRNNKKFARKIQEAISKLSFENYILFNDNDFFQGQYLNEELSPSLFVYYLRDYLIKQPYFKRNGQLMEASLLKKADLVFTNSRYLKNYAEKHNAKCHDIGQGCNHKILSEKLNHILPKELVGVQSPVVGYVGNLVTLRLDLILLEKIVPLRTDICWVFVGPLDKGFSKSKLSHYSNVIFTGPKLESELSSYIQRFDVCINPQLLNEMTVGNYPRKLDEYMAFGKPVVARQTSFTQELGDMIYQYTDLDQFNEMIDVAISEDSLSGVRERRINLSKEHTWQNSANKLIEKILAHERQ